MSIFVPLTHVLLAMIAAFILPKEMKECKMDWEGYTTRITKVVSGDAIALELATDNGATHYTFKGAKVSLYEMTDDGTGKKTKATGAYDLKKEFDIADPKTLEKAADVELKANGKSVTLHLEKKDNTLTVTEASGDSPGVFGYTDKKFPTAKFEWK